METVFSNLLLYLESTVDYIFKFIQHINFFLFQDQKMAMASYIFDTLCEFPP